MRIDVDGDIQVKFGDTHWTFNPVACSPVEDPAVIDSIPDLSKSELEVKDGRISARDVDSNYKKLFIQYQNYDNTWIVIQR